LSFNKNNIETTTTLKNTGNYNNNKDDSRRSYRSVRSSNGVSNDSGGFGIVEHGTLYTDGGSDKEKRKQQVCSSFR
jgi:hypothetical protein